MRFVSEHVSLSTLTKAQHVNAVLVNFGHKQIKQINGSHVGAKV